MWLARVVLEEVLMYSFQFIKLNAAKTVFGGQQAFIILNIMNASNNDT